MKKFYLFFIVCILLSSSLLGGEKCKYAKRFADSEMKRFPEAWQLDHGKKLFFGYSQGVGCCAMLKLWHATGDRKYYDYVEQWADTIVNQEGIIYLYNQGDYNLDFINSGKVLFEIYKETDNKKYKTAMTSLIAQLRRHPRTQEGCFWHKLIYQHQIWLDGLYMEAPYLAQYGAEFRMPAYIDDAVNQFLICASHTYDTRTGLYYHGWDESRNQQWADPKTGKSPNFWGRSMGWWFMALVDVLDFVPENHPYRPELIRIIDKLSESLARYQDKDGLWWQIVDKAGEEGNYQEASASSMYMYAYAKAVNRNYIDKSYLKVAEKAFEGITTKLIKENEDGTLSLTRCCAVAGLGGNPYRDGSYEYYVNERIRENDAKATGPFIMGCIELGK